MKNDCPHPSDESRATHNELYIFLKSRTFLFVAHLGMQQDVYFVIQFTVIFLINEIYVFAKLKISLSL